MKYLLTIILLIPSVSYAQSKEKIADWVGTGLVGVNVGMEIKDNYKNWKCIALENGLGIALAETTKRIVHKERPDKSDNKSFFSEHSELAMINHSWNPKIGISIAFSVGGSRIIAKKHDIIDVSVGLGIGYGISRICK